MTRNVCNPVCLFVEITYTTFLKHGQWGLVAGTWDFVNFYSDFAAFSESNFGKLYIIGFLKVCSLLL